MESSETNVITYELAYMLQVGQSESIIESALSDGGATVVLKGPITQVQLAYPIKKQGNAMSGFYQVTLPATEAVKIISDRLRLKDQVIRFLFVKVPKKKAVPAPRPRAVQPAATDKKTPIIPAVGNIDALSNEKLEETLEEILK